MTVVRKSCQQPTLTKRDKIAPITGLVGTSVLLSSGGSTISD